MTFKEMSKSIIDSSYFKGYSHHFNWFFEFVRMRNSLKSSNEGTDGKVLTHRENNF